MRPGSPCARAPNELPSIGVDRSTIRLALGYVNEAEEIIEDLGAALAGPVG
jgi:O-acetylhomoserine/O-acetylserine sulfhydrylase-like pyridoxal-dependent enzyme